jgi:hypothetical protein
MARDLIGKVAIVFVLFGGHAALFLGGYFALESGRKRFFGLFLYSAIAIFVFDIIYISHKRFDLTNSPVDRYSKRIATLVDIRLMTILLLAIISVFALSGRGWFAYLLASMMGAMLILHIKYRGSQDVGRLLLLIGLMLTILLTSKVLTVNYLIQTLDTVKHVEIAKSIVKSGTISQFQDTRYDGFLIFHVLAAIVGQLISLDIRISVGFLFAIIFPASLFIMYAFLSRRGFDQKLILLAIVLLALSPPVLEWGTKVHYQSLSFVYFSFVLFLLSQKFETRTVIISTPIFVAWVSTHHLSVLMASVLLSTFVFIDVKNIINNERDCDYISLILCLIIATKWTITTSWFITPIVWLTRNSPRASSGVGSSGVLVGLHESIDGLFVAAIPFLLDYLHLSFLLALSSIGVVILLNSQRKLGALFIGASVGSVFYFPNPLWIPLRGLGTLLRWQIMVQPLIVVLSGAGLFILIRDTNLSRRFPYYGTMIFIILLLFLMISSGFFAPTTSDFVGADRYDRQYLTNQDLEAAGWVQMYSINNDPIYATSKLLGYIRSTSSPIHQQGNQNKYHQLRVTDIPGRVIFSEGLTVFQRNAFQTEAIKVSITPDSEYYTPNSRVSSPVSSAQITYNPNSTNTIYTSGKVVIYKSMEAGIENESDVRYNSQIKQNTTDQQL